MTTLGSGWWQGLAPRERRVVAGGAAIALASLTLVYAVLPFARQWQAREAAITQQRQRLATLEALRRDGAALTAARADADAALAGAPQRLLAAPSATLAAAGVQSLVQEYADRSRVTINRLDAASGSDSSTAPGVHRLPINVAGTSDIYGVAELLAQLANGPRRVRVEQLTIQQNPALRGAPDVLQLTLALSAPWVPTP